MFRRTKPNYHGGKTPKMEAAAFSKVSETSYHTKRRHIPEDNKLHIYHLENLASLIQLRGSWISQNR
jgi:hypothetical protein